MSLLVAKGCTILGLVNNFCCWAMPEKMISVYKAPTTPHNIHLFKVKAAAMLSFSVVSGYNLFIEPDLNKGLALAQVPWLLHGLRSMFIDESHKTIGTAKTNDSILFLLCPAFFYYLWHNVEPASTIFGGIMMINGISAVANPSNHAKAYRQKAFPRSLHTSLRALGFAMTALGTFTLGMKYGLEPPKAFGYAWISFTCMIMLPQTKEGKNLQLSKPAMLLWVPVHLLAIGYCCLGL